jgi:hypothetical protein
VALLATIFLYFGGHTFYYGSKSAAFAPLVSGTALLAFIVLCLQGLPQAWFEITALLWRWLINGMFGNARHGSSLRISPATAAAWSNSPDAVRQRRRRAAAVRLADRFSPSIADRNGSRANPAWGVHSGSGRPLD